MNQAAPTHTPSAVRPDSPAVVDALRRLRVNDDLIAGGYVELNPYAIRDVRQLQHHLATAQAMIRVQRAQITLLTPPVEPAEETRPAADARA